MMGLRYLLHSTCHVLGHPNNQENATMMEHGNGVVKGVVCKVSNARGSKFDQIETSSGFQMPMHYPRFTKANYEKMEEWKIDLLLREYGLIGFKGTLQEKRDFAIGAFLWPHQC